VKWPWDKFSLGTTVFPCQYVPTNSPNLYSSNYHQCYTPSVIDSIAKKHTKAFTWVDDQYIMLYYIILYYIILYYIILLYIIFLLILLDRNCIEHVNTVSIMF
jgi:hypothetical protein